MSRVEPKKDEKRESHERNEPVNVDRTPGKAEGDENTVDEALRNDRERDRR